VSLDLAIAAPAPTATRRNPLVRGLTYLVGATVGTLALVLLLPQVSGAPWRAVASTVTAIPAGALAALVALWAAGLLAHTLTLAAALPGLTHRRALFLSLTGSAVSNVLPLGGAAGIALNYRMTRRWGFTPAGFASYTVVTNLWDVLAKLLLPALVLPLVVAGLPVGPGLSRAILTAAVSLPLVAGVTAALLVHPRALARLGGPVERARSSAARVVVTAWRRLSAGMALYTALLFALLLACLEVASAGVPWQIVLVAFCAERLATLVGLTPGGVGLVEVGLAGALMLAPGAAPSGVAAGVLLYRALTFGLEIPVGGLLLACWTWQRRGAA
jgi:uncharacterized membrane protein YbhN (UPF0104 family)